MLQHACVFISNYCMIAFDPKFPAITILVSCINLDYIGLCKKHYTNITSVLVCTEVYMHDYKSKG